MDVQSQGLNSFRALEIIKWLKSSIFDPKISILQLSSQIQGPKDAIINQLHANVDGDRQITDNWL